MYFVYIIQSSRNHTYYFGSTSNIHKRIKDHNSGKNDYTRNLKPWKLIWCGIFNSKQKAEAFERYLKTGSGYAFSRKRLL